MFEAYPSISCTRSTQKELFAEVIHVWAEHDAGCSQTQHGCNGRFPRSFCCPLWSCHGPIFSFTVSFCGINLFNLIPFRQSWAWIFHIYPGHFSIFLLNFLVISVLSMVYFEKTWCKLRNPSLAERPFSTALWATWWSERPRRFGASEVLRTETEGRRWPEIPDMVNSHKKPWLKSAFLMGKIIIFDG